MVFVVYLATKAQRTLSFTEILKHIIMKQSLQEILEGSVEEKIEAAEAIWNGIDEKSG